MSQRLHWITGIMVVVAGLLSATAMAQSVDRVGTPEAGLPGVVMSMSQISNAQANANLTPSMRPAILKPAFRLTGKQDGPAAQAMNPTAMQDRDLKLSGTRKAQSLATSFLGANFNDGALFPPDSMGAVGPTQFIVAINNRFRSFSKTTGSPDGIMDVAPDVFFAPAKTPLGGGVTFNFTSDPKIRYDGLSKRWYIIMIDVPNGGSLPNRLMIAVSDTDVISPSTLWTFFYTAVPAGRFLDYPTLGIDANALYIGGNMFSTSTSSFLNCDVWVVRKSSIVGSGPIVSTYFANIQNGTDGAFTPQGVDDPDGTLGAGYFVGVDWLAFNKLVFNRVTNPGTTPVLSANIPLVVPATRFPGTVPHLGNTGSTNGNLDSLDDRLFSAQARASQIWTSHNILVDTAGNATTTVAVGRNGVRWYQIGNIGATPTLTQSGTVFDNNATLANARWFSIPSLAVSGQGHAAVGFTSAGAAFRANASFAGRLAGAAAGTMDPVADITATTAAYNPPGDPGGAGGRRWGDYSFTSVDPADNMTMWTIQEYASATNIWGVQVAKLLAPPPAAITSVSPSTVNSGLNSVTLTITGVPAAGPAYYDPGPAFANRLKVDIPGITINSVISVNASQVVVNASTLGSAAGAKTITVINPDGQTVSAGGLLSVNGGAVAPVITSADSTVCAVGVACNFSVSTAGVPAPAITVTGVLPSGVSVTGGVFSGTPAAATQGTYPLTVSAVNASGTYNQPFTLIVTAACGGFTDVAPSDIFCNSSEWLKNRGVTLGCTSTTLYCPTQTVTRAQMSLFMQRLGDALQPVVAAIQQAPGALILDVIPVVCQTADIAPANYPRVAVVNWSFAGEATGPLTARGVGSFSTNGGVLWNQIDIAFMRATAGQAGQWATMTGLGAYAIPAGQTVRFSLRLDRQAATGPGNFGVTRCHLQTTISSQTGTSSPYDAYFGPRDSF